MKKVNPLTVLLAFAILFVLGAIKSHAKDATNVNVSSVYRFIGFTTATTDGDAGGLIGMNAMCQAEYGPRARMCNTEEFYLSPNMTSPTYLYKAWIQPAKMNLLIIPPPPESDKRFNCLWYEPVSGIVNDVGNVEQCQMGYIWSTCCTWTCNAPEPPIYDGPIVQSLGRLSFQPCHIERTVTCCAPIGTQP